MLNISLPASAKVELRDLLLCIVVNGEKFSKSRSDLDLGPTMPNIELVPDTTMYSNFMFLD